MLAPVQKPRRLPAADARRGSLGSLLHGGAQSTCKHFTSPGAASGARNREGRGRKGGRGEHAVDNKEDSREDAGEEYDWTLAGNDSGDRGTSFTIDDESLMEVK